MPTVREIEQALFRLAPKEGAMDWDNVGQLLGDPEAEVRRVLVALDITEAVADEAIAESCQLIVSHHPVMNCKWLPVQTVRQDTPQGHLLLKILRSDLSAICMHTNLDVAPGGVNDALGRRAGAGGPWAAGGPGGAVPDGNTGKSHAFTGICKARLPGARRPTASATPGTAARCRRSRWAAAPAATMRLRPSPPGATCSSPRTSATTSFWTRQGRASA